MEGEKSVSVDMKQRVWCEQAFQKINRILGAINDDDDRTEMLKSLQIEESKSFFDRLLTFDSLSWSLKPPRLRPPLCSRLGWQVIKPNVIQCVGCHKILSAQLPPVWKTQSYERSVAKLEKALKESHEKYCHWPLKNSPDNYLYEMLLQREKSVGDFKRRLSSLLSDKCKLPKLAKDIPDDLKLCCRRLQESSANFLSLTFEESHLEAVTLALTGWSNTVSVQGSPRIKCDHCLRLTDASLYNDNAENIVPESSEEPTAKKSYKQLNTLFHPLNEHHSWCPWLIHFPAEETSEKACWMILFSTLVSHTRLSQESPRNVVLRVKDLMNQLTK